MNHKIIAIIPARGGSKRLPRKNIRELCGKPLIAWTIEQAKRSKFIDKVVVSTDDEEIAAVSRDYGADVPFLRPKELATDDSPSIDLIKHTINFFENNEKYDIIILLEPTSPLRKKNDIDDAITLFLEKYESTNSLVSLGKVHLEDPVIMKKIEQGLVKPLIRNNFIDNKKSYFPYGVIYLSKADALMKSNTFYQEKTVPFIIERWQNYEIDDIYDFICIESLMDLKMNLIK